MTTEFVGRLVLADRAVAGRVTVADGLIAAVEPDARGKRGPLIAPGFIDLHVHGWGGHDAMQGADALGGMARALAHRGVTSFLPTAVSAPLDDLRRFAESIRSWIPRAPDDGADPIGFNLEGPFFAHARRGAHVAAHLLEPCEVDTATLEELLDGMRIMTVAPELEGATALIAWLAERDVVVSLGHSDATLDEAVAGYDAGARSTTHLFNAMSGLAHRAPGLAAAGLLSDDASVELIADGQHVHPALWPLVFRAKPPGGVVLVSDAISVGGTGDGQGTVGGLQVEVRGDRATLVGSHTLAGSVLALDTAVRNVVRAGIPLQDAVRAACTNPAHLLGLTDRGVIEPGRRADLLELDDDLRIVGVVCKGQRL